jgi:hypothetical protein
MVDSFKPLSHHDAENTDDDTLKRDARAHLAKWAHLQVIAELVTKLRGAEFSWWSPAFVRDQWRPQARMQWLTQRADLRQRITTALTGLPRNAARCKTPEFQASLIDAVLEHGDVADAEFDDAFAPAEMVIYGPVAEYWSQFRARMPWEDDATAHQKLIGWLLRVLTSERCSIDNDMTRRPILTAWDVRTAIDARTWQERIPFELRAAVDEARMKHEKSRPREPFHARHELQIVTVELIAQHLPLVELTGVMQAAERALLVSSEQASATSRDALPRESGAFELAPTSSRTSLTDIPAISTRPLAIAR